MAARTGDTRSWVRCRPSGRRVTFLVNPAAVTEVVMSFAKRILLLLVVCVGFSASAAQLLPYQGRLEKDGKAQTGTFDFKFDLYAVASGGVVLWTENQTGVQVVAGAFSVKLGSVTSMVDTV